MRRSITAPLSALLLIVTGACASRRTPPIVQEPAGRGPISTGSNQPGLIPAGTTVEVRTNEAIRSGSAADGRTYAAEVTRDIVGARGDVIVPKGSPAQLVVMNVTDSGTISSERVEFALRSITVNGRNYLVESDAAKTPDRGLGKNRRTAEIVGGGAVLGTLIGAAAGGGKGAAIGALVGAAAGAAAQVLTKGKDVDIPSETVLTFRTEQPIRLQDFRQGG